MAAPIPPTATTDDLCESSRQLIGNDVPSCATLASLNHDTSNIDEDKTFLTHPALRSQGFQEARIYC
jgi:hypothetical protein